MSGPTTGNSISHQASISGSVMMEEGQQHQKKAEELPSSASASASTASSSSSSSGRSYYWYDTWRNHVLHSSVYVSVIALCWKGSTSSRTISITTSSDTKCGGSSSSSSIAMTARLAVNCIIAGIAAYCLKSELEYMRKRRRLPPGDSGLFIVGHLPAIMHDAESFYISSFRKYGPIFTHNLLMNPTVVVTEEEDVRWAMMQERRGKVKALILPHFQSLVGEESIFVKAGEEHKRLRKAFEPAFTPTAIRDYASAIDSEAQKKLAQWSESGEFQEPREWALLAMRIFFVCAFGEAAADDEERMVRLAHLFENWVDGFNAPIPMKIPGTLLARAHGYKEELGNVLKEMVDEFKNKNPPNSPAAKTSVLGRLCYAVDEDGNFPSETVLVDNLRFFLFAGFDTTKASFGAISHYLKQNPYVEALLVEEVHTKNFFPCGGAGDGDTTCGSTSSTTTTTTTTLDLVDQLKNNAPILNAVLAESWRLTAPLTNHSTVAIEELEYKGYVIPKGTFIAIDHQAHAKMNDGLYPGAEHFCFERWLPKDHKLYDPTKANTTEIDYNVMSSKFRTFNHGPHMCLGAHFAKLEVRIVLARLFQSYKLEIRNERTHTFPTKQLLNEFKLTKLVVDS